jgi:pimeloyl-ACP methyl ester carboxylesterase
MRSEKGRQQSIVSRANINELVEEVVICGDSRHLAGVYTPPSKPGKCEICVLYITAGLLHHVGPTRLHVDISRALSDQHIAGLRFDLSGIGDSESNSLGGYFKERSIVEIKSAMDFLEKKYAHKRFVLLGLCSGADDALATAQKDERVAGVVLLNGYAYKAGYYWLYLLKEFYLPRLLMFDKWQNKFTRLLALIKAKPANREKGNKFDLMTKEEENAVIAMDEDYRYIPPKDEVADIIDTLSRNKVNLYFIYNGSEYDVYTYEGQLADTFPEQRDNPRLKETYIKEADHTFILKNDRDKLIHYLKSWFKETVFDR